MSIKPYLKIIARIIFLLLIFFAMLVVAPFPQFAEAIGDTYYSIIVFVPILILVLIMDILWGIDKLRKGKEAHKLTRKKAFGYLEIALVAMLAILAISYFPLGAWYESGNPELRKYFHSYAISLMIIVLILFILVFLIKRFLYGKNA